MRTKCCFYIKGLIKLYPTRFVPCEVAEPQHLPNGAENLKSKTLHGCQHIAQTINKWQ